MMEAVVTTELETGAKSGSAGSASAVLRKRMGDNLRAIGQHQDEAAFADVYSYYGCLLYTSPSPRDGLLSRMPSSA